MKEKTFNDLLKPHQKRFDYYNSQRIYIDKADVLQLLKQVREATIAECKEVLQDYNDGFGLEMLNRNPLPTDRIKTDL